MVNNTRHAPRAATKEVNDSKKKQNTRQVMENLVSTSRSPQSTRKTPSSTSSGARKSERLAKTPSPVSSRSNVSRKILSSSSPGHKQAAKELCLSDEKKSKEKKPTDAMQVTMESDKAEFPEEEVGKKRKKMTGHSFKTLFKVQRKEELVPDTNGVMDGSRKLYVDASIMDNIVNQPPDGDGLKVSRTSLSVNALPTIASCFKDVVALEKESSTCSARLQDGAIPENAPKMTPFCESGLSGICIVCSKRKRVSSGSVEIDFCSCGATVNDDQSTPSTCKDGCDHEAAVTLESTENCNSGNVSKDLDSDNLRDGHENVCDSGKIPWCKGKDSKRNLHMIVDKSTSRFLEYWFPVQISNHQLEQYCAMLLSNSTTLRSCTKNDPVGALRDTLRNFRKCCDHPYLLDLSFQERLINKEKRQAPEVLDIAIKASGKFEVLDMMLTEIKTRGSQVLILFQSIFGDKTSSSDILAEYLDKRFGEDSFEHVDAGLTTSRKQAAVNRFNNKENGVFVFLLENRACSSGLRLLSLDTIIIYHSDWNPLNDLKALQKISIHSRHERIKVFRLYSSFTIEERSLILAKKNVNIDNYLQTSGRAIVDNLLMWGASHLFDKLSDYHAESTSSLNVSSQKFFITEVMEEFRSILSESCDSTSVISKVKLDFGGYKTNIPLFGETKVTLEEGKEPHVFWRSVLDRKIPRWKLLGEPCSRIRKKVHEPDTGNVGNKRRKVVNENVGPASVQVELNGHQATEVADPEGGPSAVATSNHSQPLQTNVVTATSNSNSNQTSTGAEVNALEPAEQTALSNEHKHHRISLLAEMMRLGHILKLSEDVTHRTRRFLEYIIKNHHINSDSPAIVQSFHMSLCWHAASISKQKVDKQHSLDLAKKLLDYECTEEQAQSVYLKMRPLKRMYLQSLENTFDSDKDQYVAEEDIPRQPSNVDEGVDKNILKIQKKCQKRWKKLERKQQEKIQEVHQIWEAKKLELDKNYQVQKSFIRLLHGEGSVRMEKLKHLDDSFSKKMEEHHLLMDVELKYLEAEQLVAMDEEKQKVERWLAEAKACTSEQGTKVPPLFDSRPNDNAGFSQLAINTTVGATSVVPESTQHLEDQNPSDEGVCAQRSAAALANTCIFVPAEAVGRDVPTETRSLVVSDSQNEAGVTDIDGSSMDMVKQLNQSKHSCDIGEVEVPETALNENVSQDKINSRFAGLLNQNEEELEVHALEAVDAATAVQSNGKLKQSGLEEGEGGKLKKKPPARNQSTLNTESVAIVDPLPTVEQPVALESQRTSEIEVETLLPVDSLTNSLSTIEPQDQDAPALENENTSAVANSDFFDTVDPVRTVDSSINAPSNAELQDQDAPVVANSDHVMTVNPVQPITKQSHTDAPTVENESTSLIDVSISEAAGTLIPIQSNIEVTTLVNSVDQRNSSQTVEAAETDLLLDESVLRSEENLDMTIDSHQSAELPTSSQNIVALSRTVNGAADSSNEALLQEANVNHHHHQRSAYLVYQTAHPTFLGDSLRSELEKMSKEKEHLEKSRADTEPRLRSECEKEIEEITKQIKQKYEMKLQEAETEFRLRKSELEKNQNKLFLNMKLAWAFRDKGLDVRPSGHQVAGTHVYMHQQSMRPTLRVPASPSSLQPLMPQLSLPHPSRSSPVTSHSVTAPPVQAVQHTSALFSTPPLRRPPLISSFTPRNPRMFGEIRSPAPHLQPHRPSVAPTMPPAASPSISPHQPTAQLPSQNGPGPQGGLPAQSSLALQREMDNRYLVYPDISPTFTSFEQSGLGVRGNVQGSHSSPAVGKDVVCLSDDD